MPLQRANLFDIMRDAVRSYTAGYIYIPLGKCANTDIKRMLWRAHQQMGYQVDVPENYFYVHNYRWAKSSGEDPSPWDHYKKSDYGPFIYDMTAQRHLFRFAVVRNPYSRLLSGYLDKVVKSGESEEETAKTLKLPSYPRTFHEFAQMVHDTPDPNRDVHWTSQSYKLAHDFFQYEFIGHFEYLEDVKSRLAAEILFTLPRSESDRAVHQTGSSSKVAQHYNDAIAELVYSTYRADFEAFGYSESLANLLPVREQRSSGLLTDAIIRYRGVISRKWDLPKHLRSYTIRT